MARARLRKGESEENQRQRGALRSSTRAERAQVPIEKRDKTLDALAKVAKGFEGWGDPKTVLRNVRAVPTCFVQLDRATQVGGWPIDRVGVVHGPSGDGKSYFQLGLHKSFLARQHFVAFVDAELTSPMSWVRTALGPLADSPLYKALRPRTYEEAVDKIRSLLNAISEARDGKKFAKDTTALVTIDSVRKLVPENLMARLKRFGAQGEKGSTDGYGGRGAQFKAALNAQWLDELVPLTYHTGTSLLFITRETEGEDEDDVKVGGGKALYYDSSIVVRVTARPIWIKDEKRSVGTKHHCQIRKTKLAATTTEHARFNFHTSNGVHAPEGFWPERDLLELARFYDVVELSGSSYSYDGERLAQGEQKTIAVLGQSELAARIEADVRARFGAEREQDLGAPLSADDEKAPDLSDVFK